MKDFYDRYGNLLPNSYQVPKQSENPTTFNVSHFFSETLLSIRPYRRVIETKNRIRAKYYANNNTWRTMEHDENPDFSIDEKISALAFFNYIGDRFWINSIPIFPSPNNSSFWSWLRPDVLAYTLKVKYPWIPLLDWIIHAKIYRSIMEFDKNPQGESSGVQLAFIMLMGLREFELIEQEKELIKQAMDIYYPEEDHPVRLAWREE